MAKKPAPEKLTFDEAFVRPMPAFNSALDINRADPDFASRETPFNVTTDDGLASRRSKHVVRTHAQLAADTSGEPLIGYGLSMRQPMAATAENDQFPGSTNQYGKQRA